MQPVLNVEDVKRVEAGLTEVGVSISELMHRAGSAAASAELDAWCSRLRGPALSLPRELDGASARHGDKREVRLALDLAQSKRLLQAHLPATTVIELKILAAKKGVTVVSLVEEAVALLLAQYKDDFI